MNWRWTKHWSFFASLILMVLLIILYTYEPERDYTGLTEKKNPDIAITFNFSKNQEKRLKELEVNRRQTYAKTNHKKYSKKRLTKGRE
jgi:hypothetical protein